MYMRESIMMTYPMGKADTLGLMEESMRESTRKENSMGEESRSCPVELYMRESIMMAYTMGKAGTLGLMD